MKLSYVMVAGKHSNAVKPGMRIGLRTHSRPFPGPDSTRRLTAVNSSDHRSHCYIAIPWLEIKGQMYKLHDIMGTAFFERNDSDLVA